jgi:hypothetical protein
MVFAHHKDEGWAVEALGLLKLQARHGVAVGIERRVFYYLPTAMADEEDVGVAFADHVQGGGDNSLAGRGDVVFHPDGVQILLVKGVCEHLAVLHEVLEGAGDHNTFEVLRSV